ncbi:hypothetical protein [Campylobacter estrildidarum]|uniref:Helix-turn-helix domain-containing protein n=1 Tax=Campylobacter estrildidarum TaxID=2510189 RepID=A0A4U7BKZ3_9BACT|nr:hypothetical protein [Campylobacter estrildidarum]TKX30800.1 hypothetical protein CQA69_04895 [Campylobacter estrildidarum]
MLNWKKIEDLNLKDVAAKTQIEIAFLEALVRKDFVALNRFNVKGFLKILSREYDLDFTDFNEEYEAYLNENNLNIQNNLKITPKLDLCHREPVNFLPFIIVFLIVVILGVGIYYFNTIKDFFTTRQDNSSIAVVDIIGQAQSNLKSLENSNVVVIDNQAKIEQNSSSQTQSDQNINKQEQSTDEQNKQEQNTDEQNTIAKNNNNNANTENTENNDITNNITEDNKTSQSIDFGTEENNTTAKTPNKNVSFKISAKTWIGLIDLQKYTKTSFVKSEDFNLSLDTDRLVLTGPAALSIIDENNEEQKFPIGSPKRFLIKDSKIKSISINEFIKLNRGKGW